MNHAGYASPDDPDSHSSGSFWYNALSKNHSDNKESFRLRTLPSLGGPTKTSFKPQSSTTVQSGFDDIQIESESQQSLLQRHSARQLDMSEATLDVPSMSEGWFPQLGVTQSTECITTQTAAESINSDRVWAPYSLRWPFLCFLTVLSVSLAAIITGLSWHSHMNRGLGADNGSESMLLGWRYSPTVIAVIYAQLMGLVFHDIRRTEPFSRMATSTGASASSTVLQAPKAWWFVLADAYIFSVLVVPPLSSSFLTSQEIFMPQKVEFNRMMLHNKPVELFSSLEAFLRTTAPLVYDLPSSPWISSDYCVLPFWPASLSEDLPLITNNYITAQSWKSTAFVFQLKYECDSMRTTVNFNNKTFTARGTPINSRTDRNARSLNGTARMATLTLSSDDGFQYEMDLSQSLQVAGFYVPTNVTYSLDPEIGPTSPFLRFNSSGPSRDRDIILLASQMMARSDEQKEVMPNYTQRAWICAPNIYAADIPVIFSSSNGVSNFSFDEEDFLQKRMLVSGTLLNVSQVQEQFHSSSWSSYFVPINFWAHRSAIPLTALYMNDFSAMFDDDNLPEKAGSIFRRFFAETFETWLLREDNAHVGKITGERLTQQKRVVVFAVVGISLAVIFALNALFFVIILNRSRPRVRPLKIGSTPSAVLGVANLMAVGSLDKSLWRRLSGFPKKELGSLLDRKIYRLSSISKLQEVTPAQFNDDSEDDKGILPVDKGHTIVSSTNWKPHLLRIPWILALGGFFVGFLVAVVVLHRISREKPLYQSPFIYDASVPFLPGSVASFAPISTVTTLFAVCVGLWWDATQQSFSSLQPYIAMTSSSGTQVRRGANLSYNSMNWTSTTVEALRNRHWLLSLIVFGQLLCQLLAISSSALFERETGRQRSISQLQRTFELRQIPFQIEYLMSDFGSVFQDSLTAEQFLALSTGELEELYGAQIPINKSQPWIYSAMNQLTRNGSEPHWSRDGWNFVPVELPKAENRTKISISTPAIRGQVECSPTTKGYDLGIVSSWLQTFDFTNASIWNGTHIPEDISKGYWLTETAQYASPYSIIGFCPPDSAQLFRGGRWSDLTNGSLGRLPRIFSPWPVNFTTTWLNGPARAGGYVPKDQLRSGSGLYNVTNQALTCGDDTKDNQYPLSIFTEVPEYISLECRPVIEQAESWITVDHNDNVLSYTILTTPVATDSPWKDVLTMYSHNSSDGNASAVASYNHIYDDEPTSRERNVTTSYGVYFLLSLITTEELENDTPTTQYNSNTDMETPYFIHDTKNGLDADIMTYCVYVLADKNATALTNETRFAELVNRTFMTFFQHFISGNTSFSAPNWAFQPIGAQLEDLGPRIFYNRSEGWMRKGEPFTYPDLHTNRSVEATSETEIEILTMNPTATWLSVSILAWLILTTIVILIMQRQYLSPLRRNVECLADVMVLLAGSERFLQLVRERGVEELAKDDNPELRTRLGWFRTKDGDVRWGVELVERDEPDAVEWLDEQELSRLGT